MKKIYRIGIDARLYEETGVGRYIRNLIQHLASIDANNHYLLFLRKKTYITFTPPAKNFSKVLADIRWHVPLEQIVMPYFFYKQKLDLVHFPYQNFSPSLFYFSRFVVTIHDVTIAQVKTGRIARFPQPLPQLKEFFFRALLHSTLQKSCNLITVSKATKKDLISEFKVAEDKISVIGEASGVQPAQYESLTAKKLQPYFLYVGSAHPHKNLELLIDGFKEADTKGIKLVLVGDDDFFYPRLKNYCKRKGLQSKVFFAGYQSDDDLASFYEQAEALVFPSLAEGFGLPLIEAMSLGCLVVASDIPVPKELCAGAARFFDPCKKGSLVRILRKIAAEPFQFKSKIKAGLSRAGEFSWDKTAQATLKVYESCLGL